MAVGCRLRGGHRPARVFPHNASNPTQTPTPDTQLEERPELKKILASRRRKEASGSGGGGMEAPSPQQPQ